jgi:E3 ubiquitin-protein ligase HECTD4
LYLCIKELDIENLQLLSNELLGDPEPHGALGAKSLLTSSSINSCLAADSRAPLQVFYNSNSGQLRDELTVAIARAANQGEDYVIELSNQICMCLQVSYTINR